MGIFREWLFESGYEEAGELISQRVPEIQALLKSIGISHKPPGSVWSNEENEMAIQLGKIIDSAPETTIPAKSIITLKNLANKVGQEQLPQQIAQISGQPDAAMKFVQLMQSRDSGEGRNRGYDVSSLIRGIQSGNYEAPVLLKGSNGLIVIGGRTRLYAALALGSPIRVKIIDQNTFSGMKRG
jgi:hypothetical protein